jgi:kynurenine formamidase
MPLFPGDPPVTFAPMGGYAAQGYRSHLASLPAHSGTHVDAPAHVLPGAALLSDLPLDRFAGAAALADLRGRPGLAITEADIAPHLPRLRAGAFRFVLLRTGDEERFHQADYYTAGAHLTPGAAALLAGLPKLSGVGLDAASADPPEAGDLPAHRVLLGAGLVIVENLRGLAQLPVDGFDFFCLPVLPEDGSPVRAAARRHSGGGR